MTGMTQYFSLWRRVYLNLYIRMRFWLLSRKHSEAVREAAFLGMHLEEDVFPSQQEEGEDFLSLDCGQDTLLLRQGKRDPDRPLPDTANLAQLLRSIPVESIRFSTRLDSNQVVESLLVLLHVREALPAAEPAPGPIAETWAPAPLASLIKGDTGFHKFCALMRYQADEKRYEVDYAYCEMFFTNVLNSFIRRHGRTRDHRTLFAAAPWAGVIAAAIIFVWSFVAPIGFGIGIAGGAALALVFGVAAWYAVFTIGSVQYDREHRDALLRDANSNLEERVRARTRELQKTQDVTFQSLASLAETRDPETGAHIERTRIYVRELAAELRNYPRFRDSLDDEMIDLLYRSAPLHDIGKVGVPDHILLKPDKLTDEEFEHMKLHTVYGGQALRQAQEKLGHSGFLTLAREIALTHHEKWDGSGYPEGVAGDDIPVSGRLMALADVYDALISKRVYKEAFTHEHAAEIIHGGRGKHFDPEVVDAFAALEQTFMRIVTENSDDNKSEKEMA